MWPLASTPTTASLLFRGTFTGDRDITVSYGPASGAFRAGPIPLHGPGFGTATLTGLAPGTRYEYWVEDGRTSSYGTFRTAPLGAPEVVEAPRLVPAGPRTWICDRGRWDDPSAGLSASAPRGTLDNVELPVRCIVEATNAKGTSSVSTVATVPSGDTIFTRPPQVVASVRSEGEALVCSGAWSGVPMSATATYEWLLDGVVTSTGNRIVPTAAHIGHALACRISVTNVLGTGSGTSGPVRIVEGDHVVVTAQEQVRQAAETPVRLTPATAKRAAKAALERRYGIHLRLAAVTCVRRTSVHSRCAAWFGQRRLRADVRGAADLDGRPRVKLLRPWPRR